MKDQKLRGVPQSLAAGTEGQRAAGTEKAGESMLELGEVQLVTFMLGAE